MPRNTGRRRARRGKKRPIGIDDQGQIIASTVSESHEQAPSQVPELLDQIDGDIDRFVGDGIYGQELAYTAVENHSPGVRVIIPPRKDAVLSPTVSTTPTQRDQHLLEIERAGQFAWKRTSGYYDQANAENAFSRFKRTFGNWWWAKREESQERKPHWLVSCSIECWNWLVHSPTRLAKQEPLGAMRGLSDLCNKPLQLLIVSRAQVLTGPTQLVHCIHTPMVTSMITRIGTMSGTVRARFKAGVLGLLDKVDLSDGAEVSVTIIESSAKADTGGESMREALNATAGAWKSLIDAETLKRNIYEDRLINTRPVPQL